MPLKKLPDVDLRGHFERQFANHARALFDSVVLAPEDTGACYFAIYAPIRENIANYSRAGQELIKTATLHSVAAQLSAHVAKTGWSVHVPMLGNMMSANNALMPIKQPMREIYAELATIINDDAARDSDMQHDIGAKGRTRLAEERLHLAMSYALITRTMMPAQLMSSAA